MSLGKLLKVTMFLVVLSNFDRCTLCRANNDFPHLERYERQNVRHVRFFRDVMMKIFGGLHESMLGDKLQERIPSWRLFPCPLDATRQGRTQPQSVHELTLGDIDVVAAIGDSLTVGSASGAHSILQGLIEYRGLSWSGGAQISPLGKPDSWRRYLTLPNLLTLYNPNVTGGATGTSHYWHKASGFNMAEHAAYSREIPGMAKRLVERMRNSGKVDMMNDWKMVTMMIGSNNLGSEICILKDPESYVKTYKEEILQTLRYLRDNLPRTFVNLVPPPDTDVWTSMRHRHGPVCDLSLRLSFTCLFADHLRSKYAKYKRIQDKMFDALQECAEMPEFRGLHTFAVVLQPFTKNLTSNTLHNAGSSKFLNYQQHGDHLSAMAVDCLHLSQTGNARFALSLYRNLLQPPARKQTHWESWPRGHLLSALGTCVGRRWGSYLKTYDNS